MGHKICMKRLSAEIIRNGSSMFRLWRMITIRNLTLIPSMIRNFGQRISSHGCQQGVWCLIVIQWISMRRLNKPPLVQGVLVDGMDFSDDKMLQGRTFSYSDTQRYRVGANYLQLPINRPHAPVATNQRDGQMTFNVDGVEAGENPHVNYEPSGRQGLSVA